MNIGIIVATNPELEETKKILNNKKEEEYLGLKFFLGNLKNNDNNVVLVKCGIGKVNAARTAQILIDKFDVKKVINVGTAGGINPDLKVTDFVIGSKLVQYDFDSSNLDGTELGEIDGVGKYFECDKELVKKCEDILNLKNNIHYMVGTIATADFFCVDKEKAKKIGEIFGADCLEMEGAAIAQVCFLSKIPFVVIRGISDTANGNNNIDYHTYCKIVSSQVAGLVSEILA